MTLNEIAQALVFRQMREAGLEVRQHKADDDGAHAAVRWQNGPFLRVRVMARDISRAKHPARFRRDVSGLKTKGRFFLAFYSKRAEKIWLMSAEEFSRETGGETVIDFLGERMEDLSKYQAGDYSRLKKVK